MGLIPSTGAQAGINLIIVSAVFLALAILAVSLRIWSLRLKKKPLALNDYLIILALVFSTGLIAVIVTAVVSGGLGQHTASIATDPEKFVVFGKTFVAIQPLWVSAITSVKISILDLYIHIFRSRKFRKFCYVGMVICGLFWVYDILVAFLICHPLAYNWNLSIPGGHCANEVAAYIAAHSINLSIDISLAVLPMPILWRLQMATRKKVEISVMFSLGLLICIISMLRIAYYNRLKGTDLTYSVTLLYMFTALEPLLGIVLASLPVMRAAGNQLFNSSAFSWAKSLLGPSSSGSSDRKEASYEAQNVARNNKAKDFLRLNDGLDLPTTDSETDAYILGDLPPPFDDEPRKDKSPV